MFNCILNDTSTALYADDTKIWREIGSLEDNFALQNDIDTLNSIPPNVRLCQYLIIAIYYTTYHSQNLFINLVTSLLITLNHRLI